ncbi:unnamed protein product, partial [marine sediment metagenome]
GFKKLVVEGEGVVISIRRYDGGTPYTKGGVEFVDGWGVSCIYYLSKVMVPV